jgi:hypothetical protein
VRTTSVSRYCPLERTASPEGCTHPSTPANRPRRPAASGCRSAADRRRVAGKICRVKEILDRTGLDLFPELVGEQRETLKAFARRPIRSRLAREESGRLGHPRRGRLVEMQILIESSRCAWSHERPRCAGGPPVACGRPGTLRDGRGARSRSRRCRRAFGWRPRAGRLRRRERLGGDKHLSCVPPGEARRHLSRSPPPGPRHPGSPLHLGDAMVARGRSSGQGHRELGAGGPEPASPGQPADGQGDAARGGPVIEGGIRRRGRRPPGGGSAASL